MSSFCVTDAESPKHLPLVCPFCSRPSAYIYTSREEGKTAWGLMCHDCGKQKTASSLQEAVSFGKVDNPLTD